MSRLTKSHSAPLPRRITLPQRTDTRPIRWETRTSVTRNTFRPISRFSVNISRAPSSTGTKSPFNCHDRALLESGKYTRSTTGKLDPVETEKPTGPLGVYEEKRRLSNAASDVAPSRKTSSATSSIVPERTNDEFDYRPLSMYLHHVARYPSDYMEHRILSRKVSSPKESSVQTLIRMGRLYKRRNMDVPPKESLLVKAARELKPRFGNPNLWNLDPDVSSTLDLFNLRIGDVKLEANMNEYEKNLRRVNNWLESIPTRHILKAKQLALEEFGEEDRDVTQWLDANKSCRYLRLRGVPNDE